MVSLGVVARFTRLQFIPVMVAPVVLGGAAAWHQARSFDALFFAIALLGSVSLHLAANAVDDVYDHLNGVDAASERLFPKDFPGWKPITRGAIPLRTGFAISGGLYILSVAAGLYLSIVVGWYAIAVAAPGMLLSYFYTAPPLKLDYRGLGLGEASIMLCFGPIPALGAYYVLAGSLAALPVLAAVPTGIMTVNVLLTHDMMFLEPYRESGKRSLTAVLGRPATARLVFALGAAAYAWVVAMVAAGFLPLASLIALLALPLFVAGLAPMNAGLPPPAYAKKTMAAFAHSVTFTLLLALSLLL